MLFSVVRKGSRASQLWPTSFTKKAKISIIIRKIVVWNWIYHAIKFGDYNVGRDGALLTLPSYMGFLLEFDGVDDVDLPLLDVDEVNRLAKEMNVK